MSDFDSTDMAEAMGINDWRNDPMKPEQLRALIALFPEARITFASDAPEAGCVSVGHLIAFAEMVERHDLTYHYSDDHRYWVRGEASLKAIREFRYRLPWSMARAIWNAAVDRKIMENSRSQFYWPQEQPMPDMSMRKP